MSEGTFSDVVAQIYQVEITYRLLHQKKMPATRPVSTSKTGTTIATDGTFSGRCFCSSDTVLVFDCGISLV